MEYVLAVDDNEGRLANLEREELNSDGIVEGEDRSDTFAKDVDNALECTWMGW